MVPVNLKSLIGKLNESGRRSLEAAAGLCLSRTNYNVEIEHWLLKIVETPNSDLAVFLPGDMARPSLPETGQEGRTPSYSASSSRRAGNRGFWRRSGSVFTRELCLPVVLPGRDGIDNRVGHE